MQRTNPLITLPGLLLTILIFLGVGATLWLYGGEAFSPGHLSAVAPRGTRPGGVTSHAEIEYRCESCHQPLNTTQETLCLDCHQNVSAEMTSLTGPHSGVQLEQTCRSCHPEHRGRDFSPALAAVEYYAHNTGQFSLIRHRYDYSAAPMGCTACHTDLASGSYTANTESCQDCHTAADPLFETNHSQRFGTQCFACHDGMDTLAEFDHATTDLPMDGAHADLDCLACHTINAAGDFDTSLAPECQACHTEPQKHAGVFQPTCKDCHTSAGWLPATLNGELFQHDVNTAFSLARHTFLPDGSPVICVHCHTESLATDLNLCVVCHEGLEPAFMQQHLENFGTECTLCHDGVDRMHDFDHNRIFLLDGRHAEATCAACHQPNLAVPPKFIGLGSACVNCHTEPVIHAGVFGLHCESCHTTTAWAPARLTSHTFPLNHGEGNGDCATCHPANYITYTCYGCHEHQEAKIIQEHREENISDADLPNCTQCHPDGREENDD